MTRNVASALQSHLASRSTSLATLLVMTPRIGDPVYLTDHNQTIEAYLGADYVPGFQRRSVEQSLRLRADSMEIDGFFQTGGIERVKLQAGFYDFAEVRAFVINWQSVGDGELTLIDGYVGEVRPDPSGGFNFEIRDISQRMNQSIGRVFSPECDDDLGGSRCKFPINPPVLERSASVSRGDFYRIATGGGSGQAVYENRIYEALDGGTTSGSSPTYDTTVGAETTDGGVTFLAYQAWTRDATVASVTNNRNFTVTFGEADARAVDDWFNQGVVIWETGNNAGLGGEVVDWDQSESRIKTYLEAPFAPQVGDTLRVYPGCNKIALSADGGHCQGKFLMSGSRFFPEARGNLRNHQGQHTLPGRDQIGRYPDARPQ